MMTVKSGASTAGIPSGRAGHWGVLAVMILGLPAAFAQTAFAQSPFSVVRDCRQAMSEGDRDAARRYAETILGWDSVVSNVRSAAEDCVDYGLDGDYRYSAAMGGFFTEDQIEERRFQQDTQAAREVLREANRDLRRAYEGRNRALVAASVHEACLAVAEVEPARAFTNGACVDSFTRNGHPDLETLDRFAAERAPALVRGMDERERDRIVRLSGEQVQRLCSSAPAASCVIIREIRREAE